MDNQTRDTYALINAHHALLKHLYVEIYRTNITGLRDALGKLLLEASDPDQLQNFPETEARQILELMPQTGSALSSFFESVDAKIQEG